MISRLPADRLYRIHFSFSLINTIVEVPVPAGIHTDMVGFRCSGRMLYKQASVFSVEDRRLL